MRCLDDSHILKPQRGVLECWTRENGTRNTQLKVVSSWKRNDTWHTLEINHFSKNIANISDCTTESRDESGTFPIIKFSVENQIIYYLQEETNTFWKNAEDSFIKDTKREVWVRSCCLEPPSTVGSLHLLQLHPEPEELPLWVWSPPGQCSPPDPSWSTSRPDPRSRTVWTSHWSRYTFNWIKL